MEAKANALRSSWRYRLNLFGKTIMPVYENIIKVIDSVHQEGEAASAHLRGLGNEMMILHETLLATPQPTTWVDQKLESLFGFGKEQQLLVNESLQQLLHAIETMEALNTIAEQVEDDKKQQFERAVGMSEAAIIALEKCFEDRPPGIPIDLIVDAYHSGSLHSFERFIKKKGTMTGEQPNDISAHPSTVSWIVMAILSMCSLLWAILLLAFATKDLQLVPDHQLNSTFQPNHNIADMLNITNPVLKTLSDAIWEAGFESADLESRVGRKELPDTEAIARDIGYTGKAMERTARNIVNFRRDSRDLGAIKLGLSYRLVLGQLQERAELPWYSIRPVWTASNSKLRQEWLDTATNSRRQITQLFVDADDIISELSDIATGLDNIQQRMKQSQETHITEVNMLKGRWLYRLNPLAKTISIQTFEGDTDLVDAYVQQVKEAEQGLIVRRDILVASAKSLDSLQPTSWMDIFVFDNLHRFQRPYQILANQTLQHLEQALDYESLAS
ncbi:hypothetical protein PG987_008144 [Apiospora arundinis]